MNGYYPATFYMQQSQPIYQSPPRILISHSSLDKNFCDVFVELLVSMGLTSNSIIYTSKTEFAVPLGVDIYEYLRKNLEKRNLWVFFMLSQNFYRSAACLNEMGAAWVRQSKCYNILLPNFKHTKRKGVINLNEQTFDLCDPVRLTELKKMVCKRWRLSIDDKRWAAVQYDFIEKMKQLYAL
jgi:hypothetical protein